MIHEDHYAYEQRAERLQDYAPQISRSAALMQARFEAHNLGKPHCPAPSVSEADAVQVPVTDNSTSITPPIRNHEIHFFQ